MTTSKNENQALQAVLAATHAAVYAYGVIAGQGATATRKRALSRLREHAERRDVITARLVGARQRPQSAAAAYTLPFPISSATSLAALGEYIEQAVAAADADLVAAAAPQRRVEAADWLAEDAQAAADWSGRQATFPGLAELASPRP